MTFLSITKYDFLDNSVYFLDDIKIKLHLSPKRYAESETDNTISRDIISFFFFLKNLHIERKNRRVTCHSFGANKLNAARAQSVKRDGGTPASRIATAAVTRHSIREGQREGRRARVGRVDAAVAFAERNARSARAFFNASAAAAAGAE